MSYQHWVIEKDPSNIIWAGLDCENASSNTLSISVLDEFSKVMDEVEAAPNTTGLILHSKKESGFILGADIATFRDFKSTDEALVFLRQGQDVLDRLATLKIPTLAMIAGFCLGGGLELALACRYRVVDDARKTKLALPEVMLGIHPGWGGSVRLPRLIGAPNAMSMMLTGRMVSARAAKKMGLVDDAVPTRQLKHAAMHYIQKSPPAHKATLLQKLTNQSLLRPILAKAMRKKVAAKAKPDHYPAPFAMIDNWVKYGVEGAAFQAEIDSIQRVLDTNDTAKNLIRLFFSARALERVCEGN